MLPAKAGRARRHPLVVLQSLTLAAVATVALAGCGDEESDDDGPGQAGGATELTVKLDADGPGPGREQTETVSCEAGTGDTACAALTSADFAPLDTGVACTEIYGGPDEVTVEGTVAGESVTTTFTRANGCEIERFDRLLPLLNELFPEYEPGASLLP